MTVREAHATQVREAPHTMDREDGDTVDPAGLHIQDRAAQPTMDREGHVTRDRVDRAIPDRVVRIAALPFAAEPERQRQRQLMAVRSALLPSPTVRVAAHRRSIAACPDIGGRIPMMTIGGSAEAAPNGRWTRELPTRPRQFHRCGREWEAVQDREPSPAAPSQTAASPLATRESRHPHHD